MLTIFFLYLLQPVEKATAPTMQTIENWKQSLDNRKSVGAALMNLSKDFDGIPHEFLISKKHTYGFRFDSLKIFFSYLKGRKQNVKINNTL